MGEKKYIIKTLQYGIALKCNIILSSTNSILNILTK